MIKKIILIEQIGVRKIVKPQLPCPGGLCDSHFDC